MVVNGKLPRVRYEQLGQTVRGMGGGEVGGYDVMSLVRPEVDSSVRDYLRNVQSSTMVYQELRPVYVNQ